MASSMQRIVFQSRTLLNYRNCSRFLDAVCRPGVWNALVQGPLHSTYPPGLTSLCRLHTNLSEEEKQNSIKNTPNRSHKFSTSAAVQFVDDDESNSLEVVEAVNTQLRNRDHGRLFAVIHFDGRQRKVTTEDILVVDGHLQADLGENIRLNKVLLLGGSEFSLVGRPVLSPNLVKVEATVIEKTLSHDKIFFWYIRRKRVKHFHVEKHPQTHLRITNIEVMPLSSNQEPL